MAQNNTAPVFQIHGSKYWNRHSVIAWSTMLLKETALLTLHFRTSPRAPDPVSINGNSTQTSCARRKSLLTLIANQLYRAGNYLIALRHSSLCRIPTTSVCDYRKRGHRASCRITQTSKFYYFAKSYSSKCEIITLRAIRQ